MVFTHVTAPSAKDIIAICVLYALDQHLYVRTVTQYVLPFLGPHSYSRHAKTHERSFHGTERWTWPFHFFGLQLCILYASKRSCIFRRRSGSGFDGECQRIQMNDMCRQILLPLACACTYVILIHCSRCKSLPVCTFLLSHASFLQRSQDEVICAIFVNLD